jgi:hypothetical protein
MTTALWNPSTVYILNDVVEYSGFTYISIQTGNVNRQPDTNPLWWGVSGGGGVTSIVAGAGITVSGSSAITITNAGVRSLTAGTGMSLTGTANNPTVVNNGVVTLTAGTGITLSGSANNPTITAVSNGPLQSSVIVVPPTSSIASFTTITAAQISNVFICSNTAGQRVANIYVPTAAQMIAQFGSNAVVEWYIGNLNVTIFDPLFPTTGINVNTSTADSNSAWCTNYPTAGSPPVSLQTKLFALLGDTFPGQSALLPLAMYKVLVTIQSGNVYYFFDYRGLP